MELNFPTSTQPSFQFYTTPEVIEGRTQEWEIEGRNQESKVESKANQKPKPTVGNIDRFKNRTLCHRRIEAKSIMLLLTRAIEWERQSSEKWFRIQLREGRGRSCGVIDADCSLLKQPWAIQTDTEQWATLIFFGPRTEPTHYNTGLGRWCPWLCAVLGRRPSGLWPGLALLFWHRFVIKEKAHVALICHWWRMNEDFYGTHGLTRNENNLNWF